MRRRDRPGPGWRVRLDAIGPFRIQREVAIVRGLRSTHARADEDAGALAPQVVEDQIGVSYGLRSGHQGELAYPIQHAQSGCVSVQQYVDAVAFQDCGAEQHAHCASKLFVLHVV